MPHLISDTTTSGYPTVTLSCTDTGVDATLAPTLGMIGCSLRQRGTELLGQRGGLAKYAASGSTMGIPLLHPWANRLSGFSYTVGGRTVALDPHSPLLHRDANGLPMHGLVAASRNWRVADRAADDTSARLCAVLDFGADPRCSPPSPSPTPSRSTSSCAARPWRSARCCGPPPTSRSRYRSASTPTAASRRARARVAGRGAGATPAAARRAHDPDRRERGDRPRGRLPGDRSFDDLFTDLERPAHFVVAGGGRRITVAFDDGYRFAQIYAPAGEPLICFEPMTAPANALVCGDGLTIVPPGAEYRAAFSITVK